MPEKETARGTSGWTTETLYVHFISLLEAAEKKNQQQFSDAKEAVKAALDAAQKAVDKAEGALVGWKESQNEWRGTIADIISRTTGKSTGLDLGWKILIGAVTLFAMLLGIFSALKH